jgi:hypothetical protein
MLTINGLETRGVCKIGKVNVCDKCHAPFSKSKPTMTETNGSRIVKIYHCSCGNVITQEGANKKAHVSELFEMNPKFAERQG